MTTCVCGGQKAVSALEMPCWDVLEPISPPRWNACCREGTSEAEKYLLRADPDLVFMSLDPLGDVI